MKYLVLLLVVVDGMSYQEVATSLEVPIGTVMSRLARARAKLAERLEGHAPARKPPAAKEAKTESADER